MPDALFKGNEKTARKDFQPIKSTIIQHKDQRQLKNNHPIINKISTPDKYGKAIPAKLINHHSLLWTYGFKADKRYKIAIPIVIIIKIILTILPFIPLFVLL